MIYEIVLTIVLCAFIVAIMTFFYEGIKILQKD